MGGMAHLVRLGTPHDALAIARVHVEAWQSAYRGHIPDAALDALDVTERAQTWIERLAVPHHGIRVVAGAGSVLGFCDMMRSRDADAEPGTAEVTAIYVQPASWASGFGRLLLDASMAAARRDGQHALTLWVLESNAPARRFYEHMGLAPDGATQILARAGHSLHEVRYRIEL
jgi:GNAT superfamily N-acetyltransferase